MTSPARLLTTTMLVLSVSTAAACMSRDTPHQYFRSGPYGAGFEKELPGVRMVVRGSDGEPALVLRASSGGLRLFDQRMVRIARLRRGGEGYQLLERDGSVRCTLREEDGEVSLECSEPDTSFRVRVEGQVLHVFRDAAAIGTVQSEQAGRLALWQEHTAASQRVLPALTIAVEAHPCSRSLLIRDSAGRNDGRIDGGRWPAEAGALLVGLSATSQGEPGEALETRVAASLAWWVSSQLAAPSSLGCQTTEAH